jgi:queuine tRNA-ribosyltransferase
MAAAGTKRKAASSGEKKKNDDSNDAIASSSGDFTAKKKKNKEIKTSKTEEEEEEEEPCNNPIGFQFKVLHTDGRARYTNLTLPHYDCFTPMFMPVGTQGCVKGLTSAQLEEIECQVILGNTYHLGQRPGKDLFLECGGLHKFMSWKRGLLTDSGGFQMVSLADLSDVTEEGVMFQSPIDGKSEMLTPEKSMEIQNAIGADIIMALDDVVSSVKISKERFEEATHRTTRWIDRCIKGHKRPKEQALFGIVQGGLDDRLRDISLEGLLKRSKDLPGFAIGGLAGGEGKEDFCRVLENALPKLPFNKPRYVMGIGYPIDIVICTAFGGDMYDCVFPSRTARFGNALVPEGTLRLKQAQYKTDERKVQDDCDCLCCSHYTRKDLNKIAGKETEASIVLTYHNLRYLMRLCKQMREAIEKKAFKEFCIQFTKKLYSLEKDGIPKWVSNAFAKVDIDVLTERK